MNHTTCQNTEGGFACLCNSGFALNNMSGVCEGKCVKISTWYHFDNILLRASISHKKCIVIKRTTKLMIYSTDLGCHHNRTLQNKTLYPLLISDVDECQETPHVCGANSTCINTNGGFICGCEAGFEMVGGSCLGEYNTVTQMVGVSVSGFEKVGGRCLGVYNTVTQMVGGCEGGFEIVRGGCLGKYNIVAQMVGVSVSGFEKVGRSCLGEYNTVTQMVDLSVGVKLGLKWLEEAVWMSIIL